MWGDSDRSAADVTIDSRAVIAGSIFFALKGERADGHDFLEDAIRAGSTVLIVQRDDGLPQKSEHEGQLSVIIVKDTEIALQDLAAWYLSQFDVLKVGITGSTGKTTTKEMLTNILSEKYVTISNEGNYNNLIGLPLSAFKVDSATEAAVFEMGMDRLGEIHRLADIVRPDAAVITNIGMSHLERLGSRQNILTAKTEICDFMGVGNTLIINGDNDLLDGFAAPGGCKTLTVGYGETADIQITGSKDLGEKGMEFSLKKDQETGKFSVGCPGAHNVMNGSLAVAVSLNLGMDMEQAAKGLKKYTAADMRLHIVSSRGIKIIDDSYNASPDSMKAALDVLASIKGTRRIAILGDMFELGEEEKDLHRRVGEYASQKSINVILSVGKNAEQISLAAKEGGITAFHFNNKEMLKSVLPQWVRKGDVILVKGSRGMEMDEIAKHLEGIRTE